MKELFSKPGFLPAHGTFGADLSFLMALLFTTLFLIGWQLGRKHRSNRHHTLVLWAMGSMLVYFTVYYLARGLGALATENKEGFGGPGWVYSYVFSPILTVHILAVSIGLVLAVYMIVLGFRVNAIQAGRRMLQPGVLKMSRSGFVKILGSTAVLFAIIAVFRCHARLRCWIVYISGFILVLLVLLLEKGIERLVPDGERRHRLMGTFTMVLFLIALFTSTATYFVLYVFWAPKAHG